ncbi:MAG: SNF2-related protein [Dermatophilaceae bacterium]
MSVAPLTLAVDTPRVSYGSVNYGTWQGKAVYRIDARPHVMIRARRIFPRVKVEGGRLLVTATPEVSRDIAWLLERHPMTLSPAARQALDAGVAKHREAEDAVAAILAGDYVQHVADRVPAQASRDYQVQAADLVTVMKRLLITDSLGLGKTHSSALTFRNPDSLPGLVVCPTNLPKQWQRQLAAIWPDLRTYIPPAGTPGEHLTRWSARNGGPPHVFIVPYSKLSGWQHHLKGVVRAIVFDEAQELRTGQGTLKGEAAATVARDATYVVGATATPIYNYGGELHSIYNIVAPDALGSREEFLREWGGREWSSAGGQRHASVKDPKALSLYLRDNGLMIGRTRAEVQRELPYGDPVKVPHVIDADPAVLEKLTGDAVELARFILGKTGGDPQDRFRAAGQLDGQVRQATGLAKAPFVASFVHTLLESEATNKVVLWGWHHAVYDIWSERLRARGHRVIRYTGEQSPTQKQGAIDAFLDPAGPEVLIMSLRSGAGIDGLQEVCNVGVFGELDWSPKMHDQCAGRLARDGQEHEVVTYYLMADSGSDPEIARTLDLKHAQAAPIEDPNAAVVSSLPADGSRMLRLAQSVLDQATTPTTGTLR